MPPSLFRLAVFAVLLWASPLWAQRAAPATSARGGTLVVQSRTDGAEVFVDGEKVGVVPLKEPLTLPLGEHTVKVTKPGFAPLIDVYKVERRRPTRINADLLPVAGVLSVTCNVEHARVYVDGKFVGEAPLTTEVSVGQRAALVQKGGYRDFAQNFSAVAGEEIALDVKLEELPVGLNPYKPPPPPPAKWYEKKWVWGTVAAGVVVVATGVALGAYYGTRDPIHDFCGSGCAGTVTLKLPPPPK